MAGVQPKGELWHRCPTEQ